MRISKNVWCFKVDASRTCHEKHRRVFCRFIKRFPPCFEFLSQDIKSLHMGKYIENKVKMPSVMWFIFKRARSYHDRLCGGAKERHAKGVCLVSVSNGASSCTSGRIDIVYSFLTYDEVDVHKWGFHMSRIFDEIKRV